MLDKPKFDPELIAKVRKLEKRHFRRGFSLGIFVTMFVLVAFFVSVSVGAGSPVKVATIKQTKFNFTKVEGGSGSFSTKSLSNKMVYTSDTIKADHDFNAIGPEWKQSNVAGGTLALEIRTSQDKKTWTGWSSVELIDSLAGQKPQEDMAGELVLSAGRYFQYRATVDSTSTALPNLKEISFTYINSENPKMAGFDFFGLFGQADAGNEGPKVISRSEWGADESIMNWKPEYMDASGKVVLDAKKATVKQVVIHHTAGANNIKDAKASVRAIYWWHAKGRSWGDIGYNYLVDPDGNIYEGRTGGNGVIGAHALSHNVGTIGISVMGNFMEAQPTDKALNSIADLVAYKSEQNGYKTAILPVVGHRDVGKTQCPGDNLYNDLKQVRSDAQFELDQKVEKIIKVGESLQFSTNKVITNESVEATVGIKNVSTYPITLDWVKVATKDDAKNAFDFKTVKNVKIKPGKTFDYEAARSFTQRGAYAAWVSFGYRGRTYSLTNEKQTNTSSFLGFSVLAPAKLVATEALKITTAGLREGYKAKAAFKVKNLGDMPVELSSMTVVLKQGKKSYNFPELTGVTVAAGGEYEYTAEKPMPGSGEFSAWASIKQGAKWQTLGGVGKTAAKVTFKVAGVDYSKLVAVESLKISPVQALATEQVGASVKIKNTAKYPIVLNRIKVSNKLDKSVVDYGGQTDVVIGAGQTYELKELQAFEEKGIYKAQLAVKTYGGKWLKLKAAKGVKITGQFESLGFPANPKLTSSLTIEPASVRVGYIVKATFKIKNLGDLPVAYDSVTVVMNRGKETWNFEQVSNVVIAGGEEKEFDFERLLTKSGDYVAEVRVNAGGKWTTQAVADTSVKNKVSFKVADVNYSNLKVAESLTVSTAKYSSLDPVKVKAVIINQAGYDIEVQDLMIAGRLNGAVSDFPAVGAVVTIPAGKTYELTGEKTFGQAGTVIAWPVFKDHTGKWISLAALNSTVLAKKSFDLSIPRSVRVKASGSYNIENSTGTVLKTVSDGAESAVTYAGGKYTVFNGDYAQTTNSYIRFEPANANVIMTISSYNDVAAWNKNINDNMFRGVVEVRYSSVSKKLWAINELGMDDYLKGMGETGPTAPVEHIKTQVVAARSYAYYHFLNGGKHKGEPFMLKNSRLGNGDDQTYKGYGLETRFPGLVKAIADTKDLVMTYGGKPAIAVYSSNTDGRTRSAQEAWGVTYWPYMQSVPDPDCAGMVRNGHGVGLSALGSVKRAARGDKFDQILKYYFTGIDIQAFDMSKVKMRIAIYGL